MKVLVQIGYQKAYGRKPRGQLVQAFLNDDEVSFDGPGKALLSRVEAKRRSCNWVLRELDMYPEDVLKVVCKTSVPGVGIDEECTFEALYYVSEDAPVREIFLDKVGQRGYPNLKGRLLELTRVSEEDKRLDDINDYLEEGF